MDFLGLEAQVDHAGFTRSVDPRSAKRQLRVSLSVVGALTIAMVISVIAIRPDIDHKPSLLSRLETISPFVKHAFNS